MIRTRPREIAPLYGGIQPEMGSFGVRMVAGLVAGCARWCPELRARRFGALICSKRLSGVLLPLPSSSRLLAIFCGAACSLCGATFPPCIYAYAQIISFLSSFSMIETSRQLWNVAACRSGILQVRVLHSTCFSLLRKYALKAVSTGLSFELFALLFLSVAVLFELFPMV